jgi:hypothetical protein
MILMNRSTFCNALLVTTTSFLSTTSTGDEEELKYAAQLVRNEVSESIKHDPTLAGSVLRLAFHDAVVRSKTSNPNIGGADGKKMLLCPKIRQTKYKRQCLSQKLIILIIIIITTLIGSIRYELDWSENRGLTKPLKEIEKIYELQHEYCKICTNPNECKCLSFADVLALAGAAAVEAAQGPKIPIKLGRTDKNVADERFLDQIIESESDRSSIKYSLPSAALDSLGLRNYFNRLDLTEEEMVALMGAHDLGRHVTLTGMPKECLRNLTRTCLEEAPTMTPFVSKDPDTFSNSYYDTLLRWYDRKIEYGEALFIPTDVALVVDEGLKKYAIKFSKDERKFFHTFTIAYQKLVESTATTSLRY